MKTLLHILLVLHLLGWAIVLGGVLVSMRPPKLPKGVLHGILTALVTGVLMVGIAESSDTIDDPDMAKITVKLLVALVVTALVIVGVRKPAKVTTGLLGAIAGLTALNVAIAVLWR
ncbi:hypothetical protein IC607_14900 [Cellulomonas sp. JH27-2]|uniref:hypothetical protein n=1 Tax=Cellulomonas sp. JH27-2 TaxID=2774139 RepID=UPI00177C63F6|nr:hypothetical protein [Cellulomonas sp. JH27-2]MBD8060253.1 hypothetical protein [Cellulomonas sp. JH27-2]